MPWSWLATIPLMEGHNVSMLASGSQLEDGTFDGASSPRWHGP
jgi:hypothetical protein